MLNTEYLLAKIGVDTAKKGAERRKNELLVLLILSPIAPATPTKLVTVDPGTATPGLIRRTIESPTLHHRLAAGFEIRFEGRGLRPSKARLEIRPITLRTCGPAGPIGLTSVPIVSFTGMSYL